MSVKKKLPLFVAVTAIACGLVACDPKSKDVSRACSVSGDSDGPGAGIINGKTLQSGSRIAKGTVFVATKKANGEYIACSASLIAPDLLLTAAHCVRTDTTSELEKANSTRVVFSTDPQCSRDQNDMSGMRMSRKVVSHPEYNSRRSGQSDVALIFLASPAPATAMPLPVSMRDENIAMNEAVFIAGYGRQSDLDQADNSDLKLRYTELHKADGRENDNNPWANQDLIFLKSDEGTAGCSGDSGGPAMVVRGGRLMVVGVASFVMDIQQRRHTCQSRIAYTKTEKFADWISANSEGRISRF